ncbi:MAG: dTMP kinase [Candidatus Nanopelagicales bacterium]|nr:dTMP kinase [Candidatus Nanopelagicales bacterium]MCF8538268.1 dTMP kinase [Candidatus Nanopelagicales bacterium]MCF8543004.1 dTMP kinase [Candidatus Nanopelagicales bacterium]MCF8557919.1 dTMP kinase [Candidatus Nanopelagicales bacterium]
MSGYFIVFEGGEGAGKSTQEALLTEALEERGLTVTRTREPGGTPAGEEIRRVVLSPEFEGLDPRAEALLFAAARGEHVARVIRPALERGEVVICDRYLDSSVAYQGYARGLGPRRIRDLSLWATNELLPDLTIVLDIDPADGLGRFTERDRLEAEPLDYHRQVRAAYLALAEEDPERYLVLDARDDIQAIAAAILARVSGDLEQA